MEALRQYIMSVVAGACLCGLVLGLIPDGKIKPILKLLCGFFMAVTVLEPVSGLDLDALHSFDDLLTREAAKTAAAGAAYSEKMYRQHIKEETEAYILDKAAAIGAGIDAEVGLDEDGIPVLVRLSGDISPYDRALLADFISDNLGISKENQVWTS